MPELTYTPSHPPRRRGALSLIELLLVVTILGIVAALVVPRASLSKKRACGSVRAGQIAQLNALLERYEIEHGSPAGALADLTPAYLPDGLPVDPDGGTYGLDSATNRVAYTPHP